MKLFLFLDDCWYIICNYLLLRFEMHDFNSSIVIWLSLMGSFVVGYHLIVKIIFMIMMS